MRISLEKIKFVNLKEKQEYIDEVARLYWKEWSEKKGDTIEGVRYRTEHCLKEKEIPQTYIALYENELVGIVSLWRNDLCARQDLYPWMAGLYVKEDYRNLGIGMFLQNKIIEVAKSLEYSKLYLITEHENYYEKNHWKYVEQAPLGNGEMTRIYVYDVDLK